jgi:hypothetical protein
MFQADDQDDDRRADDNDEEEDDPEHCQLYAVLNLPRDYDAGVLVSQSRSLLRAFHPDKAATDDVQPTFLQIKLAVDTLSDPILKEAYDYGGMKALQIIKNHAHLYQLLADRAVRDDRLAILARVLSESQQARQRSTRPQWMSNAIHVSANAPVYLETPTTQSLERNSLFVTWKQNINNHIKATLTSNGLLNLDFSSLLSVTMGQQLMFHASRVFADSQSIVKFSAGRGTASIRSMRNLHQNTLFTVWGIDLRGVDGTSGCTVQSLMVSIQTAVWKVRLAVADYFIKVSATQWGWHGSLAWGLYGARYKLSRSYTVRENIVFKYGAKLTPGAPVLPILYLSTPQLSLRIPVVGPTDRASSFAALVTTLLVVEGIEALSGGDDTFGFSSTLRRNKASETSSNFRRWDAMVRSVADRKAKGSRLKILRARFGGSRSTDGDDDDWRGEEECGHWLQFWIDEWAGAVVLRPDDPRWTWLPKGPGTIRYSFDDQVYETSLATRPGTLRLPAPDAMCLGDAAIVR